MLGGINGLFKAELNQSVSCKNYIYIICSLCQGRREKNVLLPELLHRRGFCLIKFQGTYFALAFSSINKTH